MPDAAKNLVAVTGFKHQAQHLGIRRLEANSKGGSIEFAERTLVQPAYIIKLIQTQSRIYKLEGGNKLKFAIASNTTAERLELVKAMLADMQANASAPHTR